ncbi:MAG: hypothetical protein ACI9XU_000600 [Arenicella sp.]|jgi:hypothetical protein
MEYTSAQYISLLANIAEITALVLVLATVYLISQEIKETRRIYTANAQTQIGIHGVTFLESIYRDPEVQEIWIKGITDSSVLNESETVRLHLMLVAYFTLMANGFYLSQVDHHIEDRIEGTLDGMLIRPDVLNWWLEGNYNPSPDFKGYVDKRIEFLKKSGAIEEPVIAEDPEKVTE